MKTKNIRNILLSVAIIAALFGCEKKQDVLPSTEEDLISVRARELFPDDLAKAER